jgi:hypothetical protein
MKQYVTHVELEGEIGRARAIADWKRASEFMTKRKQGEACDVKAEPARKRRRVKTFQNVMTLHNMLLQSTGKGLEQFAIPRSFQGKLPCPFTWSHLNLCPDQGPDNMCLDTFLAVKLGMNISCDWDGTHGAHNDGCKESLKQTGLWRHMLHMMTAMNTAYGSSMSPVRLDQIRQCATEYMDTVSPATDPWYQFWLPHMVRQYGSHLSVGDEDVSTELWERLKDAPVLWWKGAKCNLAKYMLCIRRSREDMALFAIKACLYGYVCFQHGYKLKAPRRSMPVIHLQKVIFLVLSCEWTNGDVASLRLRNLRCSHTLVEPAWRGTSLRRAPWVVRVATLGSDSLLASS